MRVTLQDQIVPHGTALIGKAALVSLHDLAVPISEPCVVSSKSVFNSVRNEDPWRIYDKKYSVDDSLKGHLTFAFKHEGVDLLFLKRLFQKIGPSEIVSLVQSEPAGQTGRRAWFFYEFLMGEHLDIPDCESKVYLDALDPKKYLTSKGFVSARHRVRDNLLGGPDFCPIVRRTDELDQYIDEEWDKRAMQCVGQVNPAIVARAASFMLLADSQASYQIEGERPARSRLERWMRVVAQAGGRDITVDELVRLQSIIIDGDPFVKPGLRQEGGFIGGRDWDNNPLPEFISARHEDVPSLLNGMLSASKRMGESDVDPVVHAASLAFGFVFAHPFEDGNGRLHRFLMHSVLAERRFAPKGLIFPISSVLLERQEEYAEQLRRFSGPLLPFIEWQTTERKNVQVTNDTADLYRYGDYTDLASFLYRCVVRAITHDLPNGIAHLKAFDVAKSAIAQNIQMPDNTMSLLITLIRQNGGHLARRRRDNEFKALSDDEVLYVEEVVADAFVDQGFMAELELGDADHDVGRSVPAFR